MFTAMIFTINTSQRTHLTPHAVVWLVFAPIAIMTLASFFAFVVMALGQSATNGATFYGFGSFYGATPLVDVLWWVAFALTAVGMLGVLSATLNNKA